MSNQVCDFQIAPGQTTTNAANHTHSHDGGAEHSHSHSTPANEHGHTHEIMENAGKFAERDVPNYSTRDWKERAFTIGIGGPVGSGKTALLLSLCQRLRTKFNLGVVTNDIFTREDQEFLIRNSALTPSDRVQAIETGGCPHAAIREDISSNLEALEKLQSKYACEMLFVESGGDNLAASYSSELADLHVYVIDVSGGDKVPRKGGPGISQSDILVINKIDLAPYVGASLDVMKRDAAKMRDAGPTIFTSVKHGDGVEDVIDLILSARKQAGADGHGRSISEFQ